MPFHLGSTAVHIYGVAAGVIQSQMPFSAIITPPKRSYVIVARCLSDVRLFVRSVYLSNKWMDGWMDVCEKD